MKTHPWKTHNTAFCMFCLEGGGNTPNLQKLRMLKNSSLKKDDFLKMTWKSKMKGCTSDFSNYLFVQVTKQATSILLNGGMSSIPVPSGLGSLFSGPEKPHSGICSKNGTVKPQTPLLNSSLGHCCVVGKRKMEAQHLPWYHRPVGAVQWLFYSQESALLHGLQSGKRLHGTLVLFLVVVGQQPRLTVQRLGMEWVLAVHCPFQLPDFLIVSLHENVMPRCSACTASSSDPAPSLSHGAQLVMGHWWHFKFAVWLPLRLLKACLDATSKNMAYCWTRAASLYQGHLSPQQS